MINQNNQQSKSYLKIIAITSFISGVASLILGLLPAICLFIGMNPMEPSHILNIVFLLPITFLMGLIFGISSLKSTKRNFAIAGIVSSMISLLITLFYFLLY